MVVTMRVADLTFGGAGEDNPVPWGKDNFDLDAEQQTYNFANQNVIAYHAQLGRDLNVTGLVRLNEQGYPMVGPNDLVYLPCPQFCN